MCRDLGAEGAERVRLVDHQPCTRSAAGGHDLGKRRHVPADRIQTLDDDEAPPAVGLSGQFASQIGRGVVAERKHLRTAQLRAVVDAGVALEVEQHRVLGAAEA